MGGTGSKDASVSLSCLGKFYATQTHKRPARLICCNMVSGEALFTGKKVCANLLCIRELSSSVRVEEENAVGQHAAMDLITIASAPSPSSITERVR